MSSLTQIFAQFIVGIKDSIKLKKPPRTDKARWMAFLINILLVWLLQDYLTLTAEELAGAFEISRYAVYIYSEAWFRSPFVVGEYEIQEKITFFKISPLLPDKHVSRA